MAQMGSYVVWRDAFVVKTQITDERNTLNLWSIELFNQYENKLDRQSKSS